MKKLFIVFSLFLVILSFVLVTPKAHASYNCSAICSSDLVWPGNIHGAETQMTISNPSVTGSDYWHREVFVYTNVAGKGNVLLGIEKNGSCGPDLYFKSIVIDSNGNNVTPSGGDTGCWLVDSSDYNNVVTIEESYFTSGGGGVFTEIKGNTNHTIWYNLNNDPHIVQVYNNVSLIEEVKSTFSGHLVWGSKWVGNQWESSGSSNWYFQKVPNSTCGTQNGCPSAAFAVPMYWHTLPGNSTSGGELWSCVYEQGSPCTLGS